MLVPTSRHAEVAALGVREVPVVRGNLFHDAHTAVLMREHGIGRIYTGDASIDRFSFLEVLEPFAAA